MEPLPPTLGGDLSASRFPLVGQLPEHSHEGTAGLERSVTQHGELLGGHLTASFYLREVRPVIGDAVGQVVLVEPGFPAAAPELLAEADSKQPDRLRVERVCGWLAQPRRGRKVGDLVWGLAHLESDGLSCDSTVGLRSTDVETNGNKPCR